MALFESASGYGLFHAHGIDEIGHSVDAVRSSVLDLNRFSKAVKLTGFTPFSSAVDALKQCNAMSEGIMTDELRNFLELNLRKVKEGKKAKFTVGVMEPKVGSHITEATGIPCQSNEYVQELLRSVRLHFVWFIDQLKVADMFIGLQHFYDTEEEEEMGGHGSEGEEEEEGGGGKRKRPLRNLHGLSKRGVCYLSHVPPHMNPSHVRQMFSQYGEVQRIYLVPDGQGHCKHDNVRAKAYSEGWIEFAKKSVAKRVANLLNGEQIGGKKRPSFYYDIWNIKYLGKFEWDDLVGEIAEKTHIREQKLTLEITACDHYLSNAEKSRTQKYIRERTKKKQKKTAGEESNDGLETKTDRPIPQQKRAEERGPKAKSKLSKDILAGVFSGSL